MNLKSNVDKIYRILKRLGGIPRFKSSLKDTASTHSKNCFFFIEQLKGIIKKQVKSKFVNLYLNVTGSISEKNGHKTNIVFLLCGKYYRKENIIELKKLVGIDWFLLSSQSYTYTHCFSLIGVKI